VTATFGTCPVWAGAVTVTRRCRDGIARLDTLERNRCVACNGDGVIPEKRLRALVLAGVRANRSQEVVGWTRSISTPLRAGSSN
jgi:hypothetical protein